MRIAGKDALQGMETAEQINAHRASVVNQLNSFSRWRAIMSNWIFHLAVWVFAQLSYPFIALWWLGIVLAGGDRRSKIALAVDQFWNTPGRGMRMKPSAAGRRRRTSRRQVGLRGKWLDKVDPGHCQRALEKERGRSLLKTLIFPENFNLLLLRCSCYVRR